MPRSSDLQHIIIAFNTHDARELDKLGLERSAKAKARTSNIDANATNTETSKVKAKNLPQVERDAPFAEAVRKMMGALESQTELTELRYAMAVHRHTSKTHVHLLLRREYTDKATGQLCRLNRLPKELFNSRDEKGQAKAGLLDAALSDALDTMIPRRNRSQFLVTSTDPESRPDMATQPREHQNLSPADEPPRLRARFTIKKRGKDKTSPTSRPGPLPPKFSIASGTVPRHGASISNAASSDAKPTASHHEEQKRAPLNDQGTPSPNPSVFDAQLKTRQEQHHFLRSKGTHKLPQQEPQKDKSEQISTRNEPHNLKENLATMPQQVQDQIRQRLTDTPDRSPSGHDKNDRSPTKSR